MSQQLYSFQCGQMEWKLMFHKSLYTNVCGSAKWGKDLKEQISRGELNSLFFLCFDGRLECGCLLSLLGILFSLYVCGAGLQDKAPHGVRKGVGCLLQCTKIKANSWKIRPLPSWCTLSVFLSIVASTFYRKMDPLGWITWRWSFRIWIASSKGCR